MQNINLRLKVNKTDQNTINQWSNDNATESQKHYIIKWTDFNLQSTSRPNFKKKEEEKKACLDVVQNHRGLFLKLRSLKLNYNYKSHFLHIYLFLPSGN